MKLKSSKSSASSLSMRLVRTGLAGLVAVATVAGLATGCLDRPVAPSTPTTKNLFVDTVKETAVDKIDLLFMIDNSISMADKQAILASAVPQLVNRLITPIKVCSNDNGDTIPAPASGCAGTQYPNGPAPEFKPVNNIHIGIVTSSLGGHGIATNFCNPQGPDAKPGATNNDQGHLLPKVRPGAKLTSYNGLGFLNWDGSQTASTFTQTFANHVTAAGEQGCGFESSLEAWYRFLADPSPPTGVKVQNNISTPTGKDQEVLDERKNFLRPDSLLAIIMLTDEDDCSIMDSGLGSLVARSDSGFHMPRGTAVCATNPNDKCCRSCALKEPNGPPAGCDPISTDSSCQKGAYAAADDSPNLRCFQQKRRFGLDLLYPTKRYVNALTQLQICPNHPDLSCGNGDSPQPNPIFANGRDTSLVFLAAITGVPWQDIATKDTLTTPDTLKYQTADQLTAGGVWDDILGDGPNCIKGSSQAGLQCAKDPLMVESITPRSGTNPITGDAIAPPGDNSTNITPVNANKINGHEYDIPDKSDLQYACIFKLDTPKTTGADCGSYGSGTASPNKPLCQNPADNSYGTTQYFAKAYPGLRQLQVLKDFGSNSIVASICPKVLSPTDAPDYGYNPAVSAIIERLKEALNGKCLPRKLTPDTDPKSPTYGLVPCEVVEASPKEPTNCNAIPGRSDLTGDNGTKLEAAVRARLKQDQQCDVANQPSCSSFNMCQINQLPPGPKLTACQNQDPVQASNVVGYCYVDQACVDANKCASKLIAQCPDTEKRLLHFVGNNTPADGTNVFIACAGATF